MKNWKYLFLLLLGVPVYFIIQGSQLKGNEGEGEGYTIGSVVDEFELMNVNDQMVNLMDYTDQQGVIVIFTCNSCPFSVAYEDRIIELHENFGNQGFPVLAINSNDVVRKPEDSFDNMKVRAADKGFTFAYVYDETQEIATAFGATRTPHVYLLKNDDGQFVVSYIGAIDDNPMNADNVEDEFLASAIGAVKDGTDPDPNFTKAIGCTIKWK